MSSVVLVPRHRLGATLGGNCLLSMTSINIPSGANWRLAGSEEISHAVSGRREPGFLEARGLANEWAPVAEPTRKTLMSDNWMVPSPPRSIKVREKERQDSLPVEVCTSR